MPHYSDLYLPGPDGRRPIDIFREQAKLQRLADREGARAALEAVLAHLPSALTLNETLTDLGQLGRSIGTGTYRFLIVTFQGKAQPVLIRPGISVGELVTQLAGPAPTEETYEVHTNVPAQA
ncbi:MAG: hypothetical protein HYW51_01090 [Candidatus Doudnabacteria bacterium]|nr:hypothetical protein [Candidatus Doudnabacteria bacterium]